MVGAPGPVARQALACGEEGEPERDSEAGGHADRHRHMGYGAEDDAQDEQCTYEEEHDSSSRFQVTVVHRLPGPITFMLASVDCDAVDCPS